MEEVIGTSSRDTRFVLFVEKEGSTDFKRRTVSKRRLTLLLSLATLALLAVIVVSVAVLTEWSIRFRTGRLLNENRLLAHQINDIRSRLDGVVQTTDSLASEEEMIRVKVNLPPLDQEVRDAGVGSLMPLEDQVIGDRRVEELLRTLDQVERKLTIQHESFGEIKEKIVADEKRLKHIPSIKPLNSGRYTDGFGYRIDPFTKSYRFHYGADFSSPKGTPVYVTADGVVTKAKRLSGFGKVIIVDHGYGYETYYGHLDEFNVKKGQKVVRGDHIGFVGNTGRSTAPHLHYEIKVNNVSVDPLDYFYEGYMLTHNSSLAP
ncbi:M23 family metallopeptidase [bacterium]|nr:M23 family metallopeptidase [bacterium]